MQTNIKVAGTTFHPLPEGGYVKVEQKFQSGDVPCAIAKAVLIPEPENPYDPGAVKVLVPLEDGSAFHIGYLPKAEPLKAQIKAPVPARVKIFNHTANNPALSPSWVIMEVLGV